jgi:hypothetical protein
MPKHFLFFGIYCLKMTAFEFDRNLVDWQMLEELWNLA